ncbi:MAG: transglycosylase domain-containing protein, partial [Actinomycetota bacterium]
YVLRRMRALGMITAEQERAAADRRPPIAPPAPQSVGVAPLFVDWTRSLIKRELGEDDLYRGGLDVTTTLDLDIQREAEKAVAEILDREGDPEAAVVVIDVATGGVRAMVGGRNKRLGDLNLVTQAKRQTGSAFKPIVLAAALAEGKSLQDTYSAPGSIRLALPGGQSWRVGNYDRRGYGRPTLERATAFSINTVFAQLIRDIGPEDVVATAKAMGIKSHLDPVHALTLGTEEISPLELATAYATIAREGIRLDPTGLRHIVSSKGRTRYRNLKPGDRGAGDQAIAPEVASSVIDALQAVVRFGTGTRARLTGYTTWAKTGTTEDHADAWFAGGAGGYVAVVWVGYPQGRVPMTKVHGIKVVGSSFPLQIWKRVMTAVIEKYKPVDDELNRVPSIAPPPPPRRKPAGPSASPAPEPSDSPTPSSNPLPIPTLL